MISLRPYQHVAIEKLRISARLKHRRILLQASTGSGKTIVACEMIRLAIRKQNGHCLSHTEKKSFYSHRKS
jgi:superfamily II DNA or RNA helicase